MGRIFLDPQSQTNLTYSKELHPIKQQHRLIKICLGKWMVWGEHILHLLKLC